MAPSHWPTKDTCTDWGQGLSPQLLPSLLAGSRPHLGLRTENLALLVGRWGWVSRWGGPALLSTSCPCGGTGSGPSPALGVKNRRVTLTHGLATPGRISVKRRCPCSTDRQTEAQRGPATCPGPATAGGGAGTSRQTLRPASQGFTLAVLRLGRALVGGGQPRTISGVLASAASMPAAAVPTKHTSGGLSLGSVSPGLRTIGPGKLLLGEAGPPPWPAPTPAICPFSDQLQALWTATPRSSCLRPRAFGRPNQGPGTRPGAPPGHGPSSPCPS